MTHLPVAAAVLAALSALVGLFRPSQRMGRSWALLSIVAIVTVCPTLITGVIAAKGRFNGEGKPYIQSGVLVADLPLNERIWRHEMLGAVGTAASAILAALGISRLRGKAPNSYLVVLLAVVAAITWAVGAHLGGSELWGADTFPAFK